MALFEMLSSPSICVTRTGGPAAELGHVLNQTSTIRHHPAGPFRK